MSFLAEAKDLRAYYITRSYGVERTVKAIDDISIQIKEGEILSIAGESGCGKSTLLKVLLGAIDPPLRIVGGTMQYRFGEDYYDVLSMSVDDLKKKTLVTNLLHSARIDARSQSCSQNWQHLSRFHCYPSRSR